MANHAKISPKPPSFFRVILPHILESGTLELQKDFVIEYWKSLCKNACLEVPTGAKSKMKMKMSNGKAHLQEGWKDFAEKYSIKAGYFLVFRYHGRSNFSVQIFKPSTLEIEYEKEVSLQKEIDSDGEKANSSFSVIMKPTNNVTTAGRRATYMHIPKKAARFFGSKRENNIHLSLKGGNGKVWIMKYYPGIPPEYLARIGSGWNVFSEENNLKEGDMCTFEPVSSTDMKFKVSISRKTDEQVDEMQKNDHIDNPAGGTKRKRDLECEETCFAVTMGKTNAEGRCLMNIPKAHSARHLIDQHGKEVFLHRIDGETWQVKCYILGDFVRFIKGWKGFVEDNDLKIGDTCVFELCSKKPNHYKVAIFSGVAGSPEPN